MKVTGKHVVMALVFMVTGFILSFSYQFTSENDDDSSIKQWSKEYDIREQLNNQEERNKDLQEELYVKQQKVHQIEEKLAKQEQILFNLVEDVKKLRMIAGTVAVKGEGIEVTLADASYIPSEESANNYIVHEAHVRMVVNELLASGSTAIAINGQRLSNNTSINCVGPVISVDGNQYPAPFIITAIGDSEVLEGALNLPQGVKDTLLNDNIEVKIEKKDQVVMEPFIGKERW